MVDDQDMGGVGLLAGLAQKAGLAAAAAAKSGAGIPAVGAHPRPGAQIAKVQVQSGAVAGSGFVQPHRCFADDPRLILAQRIRLCQRLPAFQADIVGTAFQLRRPHRAGMQDAGVFQDADDGGNILIHQLLLQVDGVGGDDHFLAAPGGIDDGRQQIGQAFADAGAAFHYQFAALIDGAGYGLEHFRLLRAFLKAGEFLGKDAARRQQFLDLQFGKFPAQGRLRRRSGGRIRQPAPQRFLVQPVQSHRAGCAGHKSGRNAGIAGGVEIGGIGAGGVGDQPLQQVGNGGVGAARGAGDKCDARRRLLGGDLQQPMKYRRRNFGVGAGPVRLAVVKAQLLRQRGQVVFRRRGQKNRRQVISVVAGIEQVQPMRRQKIQVKLDIVADNRQIAQKIGQLPGHLRKGRRPLQLGGSDGSQLLDELGNVPAGIDESLEPFQHFAVAHFDGAHLDDGVGIGVQPGSFQVQGNEFLPERVNLPQPGLRLHPRRHRHRHHHH